MLFMCGCSCPKGLGEEEDAQDDLEGAAQEILRILASHTGPSAFEGRKHVPSRNQNPITRDQVFREHGLKDGDVLASSFFQATTSLPGRFF